MRVCCLSCLCSGAGVFAVCTQNHDASACYRNILKMGRHSSYYLFMFFIPFIGFTCIMLPLLMLINHKEQSSAWYAFSVPIVLFFSIFWVFFLSTTTWGSEMVEWDVLSLEAPWVLYTRRNFREDLRQIKASLLAQAQKGILEIVADDANYTTSSSQHGSAYSSSLRESKETEEMFILLREGLPELATVDAADRLNSIALSLLRDGITYERLKKASSKANGHQLILLLLSSHHELSRGQILALATYEYQ